MSDTIEWADFMRVDLRVGRIVAAEPSPQARRPAYVLQVDFGAEIGMRMSSAQITDAYAPASLVGRLVVGVVNFPPKQIGPVRSEVLVLGALDDAKGVILLRPDEDVELGDRIG